jgi:hypothetical protein
LAERWQSYAENPGKIKSMSMAAKSVSIANATQVVTEQIIKQIRLND